VISTESILKTVDESKSIICSMRSIEKKPESDNYQKFLNKIDSISFSSNGNQSEIINHGVFGEALNLNLNKT